MEPSRGDFCHPFEPYDIQLGFMRNVYRCLEDGKVGIFESPTGTGKSLSLICGTLTWLRDHARRELEGVLHNPNEHDDWLVASEKTLQNRDLLRRREEFEARLASIRKGELSRLVTGGQEGKAKRRKIEDVSAGLKQKHNEDDFMLDDYDEITNDSEKTSAILSSSTLALLDQLKPQPRADDETPFESRTKIIFCSRTHSQLSQFVHELQRVTPPAGIPGDTVECIKHVPLGSRKNLCINEKVAKLGQPAMINERCLDLQKPGVGDDHKCRYLPGKTNQNKMHAFGDRAISMIRDIEDIGNLGRSMGICPYYATRSVVPSAEIITLPYPLLLQKSAREALGVEVEGNVVVVDEAHNLMSAIADTFAVSLSLEQLDLATRQITIYVQKFKNKLKGSNRMYVTQVIRLLNSLTDRLRQSLTTSKAAEVATTAGELMAGKGVDQIKPHKLLDYLVKSKLTYKVEAYTEFVEAGKPHNKSKNTLMNVQSFLSILMNPNSEGRFFIARQDHDIELRYVLLDPKEHFRDIVERSRAVILAGGTMSPMSDYAEYLFSYLSKGRLQTFSFGHVIPTENMFAEPVTIGVSGPEFEFTFEKRNSDSMIQSLGQTILGICKIVPDGVIVFFPSYDYLARVVTAWKIRTTASQSVLDTINAVKPIFEESRTAAVESLLSEYADSINTGTGGLMLSVVGGKLSEGINFSDKLGRAVIAVGMPFPNIHTGEWKAKIEHVEQMKIGQCQAEGMSYEQSLRIAKAISRDYYENACMRAINQSIGRAIRHKSDYAAILLLDKRFATARIQQKLPTWIRSSMSGKECSWSEIQHRLKQFFHEKK